MQIPAEPVRSVAILPDIHGNVPALTAVLAEEAQDPADLLLIPGDIAAGPLPNETIALLRAHEDRLLAISGNGDRELVTPTAGAQLPPDLVTWIEETLTNESRAWLAALPATVEFPVVGFGQVHCCHATPRSDEEMTLVDSSYARWREVLAPLADGITTIVLGHTHMPFVRLIDRRTIVNPGSVGMPYGASGAHWARMIDGRIELRRTPYDVEAAASELRARSTWPGLDDWIASYLRSTYSDADAHAAFSPADGRAS